MLGLVKRLVKIYFTLMYVLPIALAAIKVIQGFHKTKKPEEME